MFIITVEQIKNKIYDQLINQNEHIILEHMPYEYFNLFWNCISMLHEGGILTSAKSVDKFCNKLQLRGSYDRNKCFQGLSEMMFWLYSIRMNYNFEIDKQLHTKSENNNSDIDIQILKDGYRFNIEVKTPNQIDRTAESVLNITFPFRVFDKKELQVEKLGKVTGEFAQKIIENSQGKYTSSKQTKIDDNKVIEYLKSGQTKFTYEEKCINVLALSVTSHQMNDYWGYLCNPYTGIFTDQFTGKFLDKNKKEVKHSDFDKVDVIYLTNIVEGHIRYFKDFDSWKLENYCSIFVTNPFSQRIKNCSDDEAYQKLLELLPNDTLKFIREHDRKNKQFENTDIPIDPIFFFEYLHDNYKLLWQ